MMLFQVCFSVEVKDEEARDSFFEVAQVDSRAEVEKVIEEGFDNIQSFTIPETGSIRVYAVELDDNNKPVAALYHDPEALWVWLYCR